LCAPALPPPPARARGLRPAGPPARRAPGGAVEGVGRGLRKRERPRGLGLPRGLAVAAAALTRTSTRSGGPAAAPRPRASSAGRAPRPPSCPASPLRSRRPGLARPTPADPGAGLPRARHGLLAPLRLRAIFSALAPEGFTFTAAPPPKTLEFPRKAAKAQRAGPVGARAPSTGPRGPRLHPPTPASPEAVAPGPRSRACAPPQSRIQTVNICAQSVFSRPAPSSGPCSAGPPRSPATVCAPSACRSAAPSPTPSPAAPPPPTTTMPAKRTARCAAGCPDQLAKPGLSEATLRLRVRASFVDHDALKGTLDRLILSHRNRLSQVDDAASRRLLAQTTLGARSWGTPSASSRTASGPTRTRPPLRSSRRWRRSPRRTRARRSPGGWSAAMSAARMSSTRWSTRGRRCRRRGAARSRWRGCRTRWRRASRRVRGWRRCCGESGRAAVGPSAGAAAPSRADRAGLRGASGEPPEGGPSGRPRPGSAGPPRGGLFGCPCRGSVGAPDDSGRPSPEPPGRRGRGLGAPRHERRRLADRARPGQPHPRPVGSTWGGPPSGATGSRGSTAALDRVGTSGLRCGAAGLRRGGSAQVPLATAAGVAAAVACGPADERSVGATRSIQCLCRSYQRADDRPSFAICRGWASGSRATG